MADFDVRAAALTEEAEALLGRLLRRGGDYADVFYEQTIRHRHGLRQRAGRGCLPAATAQREVVEGAGLRVLAAAAEGFAWTGALEPEALAAAADRAVESLDARGAPAPVTPLAAAPGPPGVPDAPDTVAASEKAMLLRAAVDAAFSLHPGVREVSAVYQDRMRRTLVATSEGRLVVQARPLVGLRVDVALAHGGEVVHAHAVGGGACGFGCFFDAAAGQATPEQVAREAVDRALHRAGARPAPEGTMPVVVAGGWGGVWLHEAVGHLLEADVAAARGVRPGTHLTGPAVTLVDDGTRPGARATAAFDDEGTATGRTVLVDAGRLCGFLTDRRHAALLGLPRTGNGRRQDYRHAPLPRMTNLFLLPGEAAPADLVSGVADGLYVETAGHGVVVPGEDRFAFDVLDGYRIEGGRRTAPVAGARVEGRLSDALACIAGVAADLRLDAARGLCEKAGQVVPVAVGMPTVLLTGLRVVRGA